MKVNIDLISSAIEGKTFQEVKDYMESNKIEVKQNDKLFMLNVDRRKETEGIESLTELERQCNGIIIEKHTNTIVAMNKNKMYNIEQLDENNETNLYEFCEDGTVVRLYYYNNNWHTATSRCIDAKRSFFWSSQQSYDDMFWELFPVELLESLNITFTYVFIILHKNNTFVVKHKENRLLFVTSISNRTFIENRVLNQNIDSPIKQYEKLNYEQYRHYEETGCDDKRGLIMHTYNKETDTWKIYKKDFDDFKMKQAIRGNTRDIKMRILEIIKCNDKNMLEQFVEIYPEHKFTTQMVIHSITKLSKNIYYLYVNSHILQKVHVKQDNDYYRILKQLHAQYKTTKVPITLKDVENKLYSYHPYVLKGYLDWV
jgi:hypothetical protein